MPVSEAFGFEESWIRRALHELRRTPDLFARDRIEEAQITLGLGNRKVLALWDWLRESELVEGGKECARLTPLSQVMLHYDASLGEAGSLWTLHIHLGLKPNGAWFYHDYATVFQATAFSRSELAQFLASRRTHAASYIEKRCLYPLLHIMRKTRLGSDFGVMVEAGPDSFRRQAPRDDLLHPAVFGYAVLTWATMSSQVTASLLQLGDSGGPGRLFSMEHADAERYLRRMSDRYGKEAVAYSATAGLNSVTFSRGVRPLHLLESYYLEHIEGMESMAALRYAQTEGLSSRLLSEAGHVR